MKLVSVDEIPLGKNIEFSDEIWQICQEMEVKCREWGGIGLSAVQVGLPYNLFVVIIDDVVKFYANGSYVGVKFDANWMIEGCLSLPGKEYNVFRLNYINFSGQEVTEQGFDST